MPANRVFDVGPSAIVIAIVYLLPEKRRLNKFD
jgi:hypothetical protein